MASSAMLPGIAGEHAQAGRGDEHEEEDKERELFGEEGFEGVVGRVASLEKKLGIEDLASFTASWTQS